MTYNISKYECTCFQISEISQFLQTFTKLSQHLSVRACVCVRARARVHILVINP